MPKPSDIYDKVVSGDSLTDDEVRYRMVFYRELHEKLAKCGSVFKLACMEALRIHCTLEGFYMARKRNP